MRKLLILAIIAVSTIAYSMSYAAEADKNVTIAEMKGTVEVLPQGSSAWVPATTWMKLGSGDMVSTKDASYADLNFDGLGQSALVRIDANSSMKIESYIASANVAERKIALNLAMGDILVKANKLKDESQFQVRTPTSVVGVRGTGFKVHVTSEK